MEEKMNTMDLIYYMIKLETIEDIEKLKEYCVKEILYRCEQGKK